MASADMMCFADEEADTEKLGTVIDKTWGGPLEPKPREDLGAMKLAPRTGQELSAQLNPVMGKLWT